MQEVEPQELPRERMSLDPRFDYPTHFTAISYTLMPEPPEHSIFVEDCAESDRPRQVKRETAFFAPEAQNDFCFGIIGGADGPIGYRRGRSGAGEASHCVLVAALCACRPCRLARRLPRNTVGSGDVRPPLTHFFCDFRYSVGRTPKALWNSVENLLWLS